MQLSGRLIKLFQIVALSALLLSHRAFAGDGPNDKKGLSLADKDEAAFQFYDLAERKASLVVKIPALQKEIKDLEDEKIPVAKKQENAALQAKTRISELEKRDSDLRIQLKELSPAPGKQLDAAGAAKRQSVLEQLSEVQAELRFRKLNISEAEGNESSQNLAEQLSKKKQQLDDAEKELNSVQRSILKITTPEQSFKATISIYSAGLIGCVILGFFVTALYDPKVRQSVFSGQAGIQFLALFSIIIAIILFGITGILGGNELAALLGSISGYILGKVSTPGATNGGVMQTARILTAPTGLRIVTGGKKGEIDVSCSSVAGADLYVWYAKRPTSTAFERVKATSQSHATLGGFDQSEAVQVKVAAANAAGEGPVSEAAAGTAGT